MFSNGGSSPIITVYPSHLQENIFEVLFLYQSSSNYPNLHLEISRYCCKVELFICFYFSWRYIKNLELLTKTDKQRKKP